MQRRNGSVGDHCGRRPVVDVLSVQAGDCAGLVLDTLDDDHAIGVRHRDDGLDEFTVRQACPIALELCDKCLAPLQLFLIAVLASWRSSIIEFRKCTKKCGTQGGASRLSGFCGRMDIGQKGNSRFFFTGR